MSEDITLPPPPKLPGDLTPSDVAQLAARIETIEDRLDELSRKIEHNSASVGTAIDLLNRLSDDLGRIYAVLITVSDDQSGIHERLRKLPCNRQPANFHCDPSAAGHG